MLTDSDYRENAAKKIGLYAKNESTIPQNLITTMDNRDGLIDMTSVNAIAGEVFV